jgi:hypothetical protein
LTVRDTFRQPFDESGRSRLPCPFDHASTQPCKYQFLNIL